ncbi:MAG: hypothetical protein J6R42_03275 [Clostridia bacterium]|nr:hypothetical protein [Clostridia bacterium]
MYKISVPISNSNLQRNGREATLVQLQKLNAERVFLALGTYETDIAKRKMAMQELQDNCCFFSAHGFEVGAWIWTFLFREKPPFCQMRTLDGTEIENTVCPTDENFVAFAVDYIKDVARCGVDIIQFDDDFRYGFLSDAPACLCDHHMAHIRRITGENVTRETLRHHIVSGAKNKYRDAFLKANGDAFRHFAHRVRHAVDEVNPSIRISFCACMSSWDLDGTNPRELATILAGQTKPLLRLIGAPYWATKNSWGNALQDVIELERMESAWTKTENIEIMAEGDAYPRPRTLCPASYLEGFDTAIRASGCTDGILKYGIDYHSNADYETGYALRHERHRDLYAQIDRMFGKKTSCGVRVYECPNKIAQMEMPTKVNKTVDIEHLFFSRAARTLAYNTIPTVYEGEGICGIVFDENARTLPLDALKHGLILDIAAAEILTQRGVDVGLERIGEATTGKSEHFRFDDNHILANGAVVYDIVLNASAEVLSDMDTPKGVVPVSYRYENPDGHRFLVLNINTRSDADNLLKHYQRSLQYAQTIKWLSGKALPAYLYGNPALYIQCKESASSLSVGLWNFFADEVIAPVVQLDKAYTSLSCMNCNGRIDGDRVILSDIQPFGFVAFEVT